MLRNPCHKCSEVRAKQRWHNNAHLEEGNFLDGGRTGGITLMVAGRITPAPTTNSDRFTCHVREKKAHHTSRAYRAKDRQQLREVRE